MCFKCSSNSYHRTCSEKGFCGVGIFRWQNSCIVMLWEKQTTFKRFYPYHCLVSIHYCCKSLQGADILIWWAQLSCKSACTIALEHLAFVLYILIWSFILPHLVFLIFYLTFWHYLISFTLYYMIRDALCTMCKVQ